MAYQLPPPPQPNYGPYNSYGQPAPFGPPVYANWLYRVAAFLIDGVVIGVIFWITLIIGSALGGGALGRVVEFLGLLASAGVGIWNLYIRQGRTGQSLGKQAVGIRLISEGTGQPIGGLMAFVRHLAHFFDSLACYIGYLWPIWDAKCQTFADKLLSTVVVRA